MALSCGIVGLPQSGKTSIFNALTASQAKIHDFAPSSGDPNIAVVPVPDARVDDLALGFSSKKKTFTTLQFVDVAGLVRGASRGGGMGNQFLAHIREVDAVINVVRCFENPEVVHVDGELDSVRDAETIHLELALADLEMVERRIQKAAKIARSGDAGAKRQLAAMEKILACLSEGLAARKADLSDQEWADLSDLHLITRKPMLYVANVDEGGVEGDHPQVTPLAALAAAEGTPCARICGKIEAELSTLPEEDRAEFMEAYGLKESGLGKLIQASYSLLDLVTYLTVGEKESRSWTIRRGTTAPKAAGKVHSDIERGFIRVEVFRYDEWVAHGRSEQKLKEKGLTRLEGKEYVIQEGDVCLYRFNV